MPNTHLRHHAIVRVTIGERLALTISDQGYEWYGVLRMKTIVGGCAIALFCALGAAAASAHGGHEHSAPPAPTPEERAAFEAARPAFERNCFRCHTTAGKKSKRKAMQHLAMDTYPFGGHHANEVGKVIRKVLGGGGAGKATMPSDDPGAVTGDDLRLIKAWADAFDKAHPATTGASTERKGSKHAP